MMYLRLLKLRSKLRFKQSILDTRLKIRISKLPEKCIPDICDENGVLYLKACEKIGFYLHGRTGSGKTTLAAAMLKACWREQIPGAFVSFQDWLIDATADRKTLPSYLKKIKETEGLLVLDDMFFGDLSDYVAKIIYAIINYRESNSLPFIITSNLDIGEIQESSDPRVVSRILGACQVMGMNDADYRKAKK